MFAVYELPTEIAALSAAAERSPVLPRENEPPDSAVFTQYLLLSPLIVMMSPLRIVPEPPSAAIDVSPNGNGKSDKQGVAEAQEKHQYRDDE